MARDGGYSVRNLGGGRRQVVTDPSFSHIVPKNRLKPAAAFPNPNNPPPSYKRFQTVDVIYGDLGDGGGIYVGTVVADSENGLVDVVTHSMPPGDKLIRLIWLGNTGPSHGDWDGVGQPPRFSLTLTSVRLGVRLGVLGLGVVGVSSSVVSITVSACGRIFSRYPDSPSILEETSPTKLGSSGQRNATRCGLWWTEMLKARDQYEEAAGVYFHISNEEPSLHAAVMLEQASYCYLLSKPPMLRRYGFHLILSSNRYYTSEQRKHAIRAYKGALSVYKGDAWRYINDHDDYRMWYAVLGTYDIAVKDMLQVLSCGHQSLVTQELFLLDFLYVVQKLGKPFEVFILQLPVINMPSLKVVYEDQRTYASPSAVNVEESLWKSLEEDLVPSVPIMRSNWLDSQPKKKYMDSNICVAGENIKVNVEFQNPLKIPISVSGFSLVCQLSAKTDLVESEAGDQYINDVDGHLSTNALQNELALEKLKSSWYICQTH